MNKKPNFNTHLGRTLRRMPKKIPESSLIILEEYYQENPYPTPETKKEILEKTGIPDYSLKGWFKKRRSSNGHNPGLSPETESPNNPESETSTGTHLCFTKY